MPDAQLLRDVSPPFPPPPSECAVDCSSRARQLWDWESAGKYGDNKPAIRLGFRWDANIDDSVWIPVSAVVSVSRVEGNLGYPRSRLLLRQLDLCFMKLSPRIPHPAIVAVG